MFWHLLKYKLKQLIHNKETSLWVFIFPLLLGTLFYLGFGSLLKDNGNSFEPIPIAAVSTRDSNSTFEQVIRELSQKGNDPLFSVTWTTEEKAQSLLEGNEIDGIIFTTTKPSLAISKNGLNQSILNTFLSQYLSQSYTLEQIGTEHPEKLTGAIEAFSSNVTYNKEYSANNSEMSSLIHYFYALIAMVCLFGHMLGLEVVFSIQPHLSSLGARKNATPVHKFKIIMADFLACVILNYLSVLLLFFYLIVILGVDFGNRIPQILLTSLAGSIIGISFGSFIGSIGKWTRSVKEGFALAVCMLCCFLGGLMVYQMPNILSHAAPWVNKINPAALIADCFYSLNVYTNYTRYLQNLASMLIIAGIFCIGSYLMLRRKTAK